MLHTITTDSSVTIRKGEGAMRVATFEQPFAMHRGGQLDRVEQAFETWGRLNGERDNAVLVFTGLSPSAHAASSADDPSPGWWEYMIGPGKPLDSDRLYIICVNSLGSCYGSTGPTSINPGSGQSYRLDFPELTIEDIAVAAHRLVEALGIERLRAVVGTSLGGMTAVAYLAYYPHDVDHLVSISAAAKATPFAIAVRSLQREIIRRDPAWRDGDYDIDWEPEEGMRLARKLGLISYRSAAEWDERFGRDTVQKGSTNAAPFDLEFQVESYLEANARRFSGQFDANAYLGLSRAMDWFDLENHPERLIALQETSLNKRALIVGVESDLLFPLHQQKSLAELLSECGLTVEFTSLPSLQGHDAFLVDKERFAPVVTQFFANITTEHSR